LNIGLATVEVLNSQIRATPMWGKKQIAGVVYDLTHLDPFDVEVNPGHAGAQTYKVRVDFGAHTFTRNLLDTDTPDFHIQDGGQVRCFCPQRHAMSIFLPDIIRASFVGKAYFGNRHENFLLIEKLDGLNAPYVVAFKLTKAKAASADAIMFVVSAHDRPALSTNLPVIRMGTLVSLTVQGKPIIRPPKKGRRR
jgi:hypothetical protein